MNPLYSWCSNLLGLDLVASDLEFSQMAARAVVAFPCALVMTRLAGKRFLGRSAGFDVVLAIMFGSVISRAINGQAEFFPTLGAGFVLVLLHRIIGLATSRSHRLSVLIKGRECLLVHDGVINHERLKQSEFSEDDLTENLRLHGVTDPKQVAEAWLERNGQISVIRR